QLDAVALTHANTKEQIGKNKGQHTTGRSSALVHYDPVSQHKKAPIRHGLVKGASSQPEHSQWTLLGTVRETQSAPGTVGTSKKFVSQLPACKWDPVGD